MSDVPPPRDPVDPKRSPYTNADPDPKADPDPNLGRDQDQAQAHPDLEPGDEGPSEAFAAALESSERRPEATRGRRLAKGRGAPAGEVAVGARVSGTVVSVGDSHVLIDIGGRSEAAAETAHFRAADGSLSITAGDTVELYVVAAGEEIVLAPSLRADPRAALGQVRTAHASGVPVSGRVLELNPGGLSVDVSGVRGFCPRSQIEAGPCEDPSVYVGRTLEFLVIEVRSGRGGVVLSRRRLLEVAAAEAGRRLRESLKPGDEHDATVTRLEAFGAFVDLGGVEGLVHVSEIAWARVGHPRDRLQPGEHVRVRVLKIEAGKDGRPRISLSIKAAEPDPWTGVAERYPVGLRVRGTIARLAEFGAFVTLEPGIDGLVHVSEAAAGRVAQLKDVFTVGQPVEAIVLSVDLAKKRIALSVRAASEAFAPPEPPEPSSFPAPAGTRPPADARPPVARAAGPAEETTMAIALRAARARAAAKKAKTGG